MRRSVLAFVVVVMTLASACDASGETQADASPSGPPSPSASAEEEALAAYEGLISALIEGSHQGATNHPYLERYAKDQALELAQGMLDGSTFVGEPISEPEVAETDLQASPPSVVVEDCLSDAEWVLEGASPEDAQNEDTYRLYEATVTREGQTWKVERLWLEDYGSCAP